VPEIDCVVAAAGLDQRRSSYRSLFANLFVRQSVRLSVTQSSVGHSPSDIFPQYIPPLGQFLSPLRTFPPAGKANI